MNELLQEAGQIPVAVRTLLVLGHNPGWQEIVLTLTGVVIEMKTATAALLTGAGETWDDALRARRPMAGCRRHLSARGVRPRLPASAVAGLECLAPWDR